MVFLYSLTLQRASEITHAVHGNFTGTKEQLIAVAKGKIIELLRPDASTGKLSTVLSLEVFGIIRSLLAFRLTGGTKDFLVVGSDSGKIVILEYNPETNTLTHVHMETFGKSGCRRIVPGQMLAADPKGRAVMIGAIEKQKLVYTLNRDSAARLTISSPLEAHKSHTFVWHMTGVDVGFENPLFACLEVDYEEADEDPTAKALDSLEPTLTFYELDLGLNHVVRKESIPLEEFSNYLITVPGGSDGPGGVLVCSENHITWRTVGDHTPIRVNIPRRRDKLLDKSRKTLVNCHTMHKAKGMFFFLIQTEYGDVFKLTMYVEEDEVRGLLLKYFDSLPVASSICLLRNGLLFVAAEFGNHALYQISKLGDNEDEPEYTSLLPPEEIPAFRPRGLLNLAELDKAESLSPIVSCQLADLAGEDTPQLYTACGKGPDSSIRMLRHGLEVTQMALTELPGSASAVWSLKTNAADPFDSYIIVSFSNATLVLSIGETVEEVTDSGFLANTSTLLAATIGEDALLQVHPEGIRHIRADKRVNEWKPPARHYISHATANDRQVAITLGGGEMVYFEMDRSGQLNEYSERLNLSDEPTCMYLAPVPPGLQRARFLAVGLEDSTVRIVSLEPSKCLQPLSTQALPGKPESLCLIEVGEAAGGQETLYLSIGLENGVLLRSTVDSITGDLSDTRTRYLGARAVKLYPIRVQDNWACFALSARPWLTYNFNGNMSVTPLSYEALDSASAFSSEVCPEGIVAVAKNTLRILALDRLGTVFNSISTPLQFTPRRFVVDDSTGVLVVAEGDHNIHDDASKQAALAADDDDGNEDDMALDEGELEEKVFGASKAGKGKWSAAVSIVDPLQASVLFRQPLGNNEMVVSIAKVNFAHSSDDATYIIVGTVKDWIVNPKSFSACFLHTYRVIGEGKQLKLQFVHRTPVEDIPAAVTAFQGRLLAGVGHLLRIYDIGKRKLLRKCESKHIPNQITDIKVTGTRICVSDLRESTFWVKYRTGENKMSVFADDVHPRWCTTHTMLDYQTCFGADKFGNVWVSRLPKDVNDMVEEDPTGSKALWERGLLNGSSQKVDLLCNFYVGEAVTSLHKATLTPGGAESVVFTTLAGGVGVFMPFANKEDIDFFQHLEMHMRTESPAVCGRDHLSFRSYYAPVKNCIDGDLCEQYNSLEYGRKKSIASELDRTPAEVAKKLEDMRNRYAF